MSDEHQFAEVTVRVAAPFSSDEEDGYREEKIAYLVERALTETRKFEGEFRDTTDLTLMETETGEEAAERQMAEAESAAEARQQRRYERHLDNRGGHRRF
jgi:hypothetical protein